MNNQTRPSWRTFFTVHPVAAVFNKGTTKQDLAKMAKDIEASGRLQARIVTVHVADTSGGKVYVVDGITRLDAMESLGWQIVDEHGNWIGAVEGMVDHRRNYSHEQVAKLVISLNAKRRHQTKEDIAAAIAETVKLERAAREKEFLVSERRETPSPKVGRPKDEVKAEVVEKAAEHGIGKRTAEKALARQPDRPKITKQPAPPKRKREPVRTFEDEVWARWSRWLKYWPQTKHRDVIKHVLGFIEDRTPTNHKPGSN
jgi:hypothetical protein